MNKNKFGYYATLSLIFILAAFIRFFVYIKSGALWHDECSLAINILNKNIYNFFGVLQHQQSAPPTFMILTKILSVIFGIKEPVLRFIPFLSAILSIPVFYIFSTKFLQRKISVIIANLLFGINYYLIYYSQEFKQYSTELLVNLLVFITLAKLRLENLSDKKILSIGLLISIIPTISLPSIFVISAYCIFLILKYNKIILKRLFLFISPSILIGTLLYFTTFAPSKSDFLISYWRKGFITLDFNNIIQFLQLNLQYYFYPNKFILFILILITVGFSVILSKRKHIYNSLVVITCTLIIIASILKLYPVMQRVSLYIVPILIICFVKPLDTISPSRKIYSSFIIVMFICSLISYNLNYLRSLKEIPIKPYNARTVMKYLSERYNNKDLIVINAASDSEFIYYNSYYNLNLQNYVFVQTPTSEKELYFKILNTLPKNQNIWFYYAYDYSHSPVIPMLKEWANDKIILNKYDKNNSYVIQVKQR